MSACKLHGEFSCGKCMLVAKTQPADRIAELERDLAAAQRIIKDHESGVENLNRAMRGLMDDLAAAQQGESVEQGMRKECEQYITVLKADLAAANTRADAMFRVAEKHEAEAAALRVALTRIAEMRDRDGNAIEMNRDELRGIAKAAL